jgi:hypothetical protein
MKKLEIGPRAEVALELTAALQRASDLAADLEAKYAVRVAQERARQMLVSGRLKDRFAGGGK